MNEYTIYTSWVAYKLRKMGFEIKSTDINPHKPQFYTYTFDDTPELRKALTTITNSRKA